MMAPGLPEVAAKYNITNPTVVALTLSIFLISFALAVRNHSHIDSPRINRRCHFLASSTGAFVRDVWSEMGK